MSCSHDGRAAALWAMARAAYPDAESLRLWVLDVGFFVPSSFTSRDEGGDGEIHHPDESDADRVLHVIRRAERDEDGTLFIGTRFHVTHDDEESGTVGALRHIQAVFPDVRTIHVVDVPEPAPPRDPSTLAPAVRAFADALESGALNAVF